MVCLVAEEVCAQDHPEDLEDLEGAASEVVEQVDPGKIFKKANNETIQKIITCRSNFSPDGIFKLMQQY